MSQADMPSTISNNSSIRQRPGKGTGATDVPVKSSISAENTRASVNIVDALRFVTAAILVSTLGSYLVTGGESLVWGFKRPWWTDAAKVRLAVPAVDLTLDQLREYDGTQPGKPIYLAINRTIYDVSASPSVYGPGGMYSTLAAKDASRSYITTCFDPVDDLVPYFGGVEEIFVPLWLSRNPSTEELDALATGEVMGGLDVKDLIGMVQKKIGKSRTKQLQDEAYAKAKDTVMQKIRTWHQMFEHKGYPVVGRVVGVDEWDSTRWDSLKFCEEARKQRPNMAASLAEALNVDGAKIDLGKMGKSG